MKKLTEDLYLIEPELYAELRGTQWFVSNEQSEILAGPYASLELLQKARQPGAVELKTMANGNETVRVEIVPPGVSLEDLDSTDLVTLSEAADYLPRTRQALTSARRRGTLKVEPVLEARTTKLYSLKALKEAYPE